MSEELKMTPGMTLAFFASVIKSGEPWTGTCQKAYDEAMAALASPTPPTTEGREELQRCLWFVINVAPKYADGAWAELAPLARALLSSPRVEDVRREERERIARIFEGQTHSEWFGQEAADMIRYLPPDGDGKQGQATRASGPTAPTDLLQSKESYK